MDGVGSEVEGMEGGGEEGVAREHVASHVSELHHVSRLEDLWSNVNSKWCKNYCLQNSKEHYSTKREQCI